MTNREQQAVLIDVVFAIIGFILSILWGKISRTTMTRGTVKTLGMIWIGLAIFGIVMIFVMRHVP
jgi:hypothetical protein